MGSATYFRIYDVMKNPDERAVDPINIDWNLAFDKSSAARPELLPVFRIRVQRLEFEVGSRGFAEEQLTGSRSFGSTNLA